MSEPAHISQRYLHTPAQMQRQSGCIIGRDYPMPIADHAVQKGESVRRFKEIRQ
jgi:deoxyribodipyrimidine photo-lyase